MLADVFKANNEALVCFACARCVYGLIFAAIRLIFRD